jgi:HD-like signal output (HDOD) protein/CheY-like chemotaxis protein
MTHRILFVDDEPRVLDGLRDLLRRERREWDMQFALGGQAAINRVNEASFDVVVSDVLMPDVDGTAVLRHVRDRRPRASRLVLSGQVGTDVLCGVIPLAHQILGKPCDADQLRGAIRRALSVGADVSQPTIGRLVRRLDHLPPSLVTCRALAGVVAQPGAMLDRVSEIVERDPSLTAKVLHVVNNPYFGLPRPLTTVRQAVVHLGLDIVRSITFSVLTFIEAHDEVDDVVDLDAIQRHSVAVALRARERVSDPALAGEAFTTGIVHEIGRVILALEPELGYAELIRRSRSGSESLDTLERLEYGLTQAEVGAQMLSLWGFPASIVGAVAANGEPLEGEAPEHVIARAVSDAHIELPDHIAI